VAPLHHVPNKNTTARRLIDEFRSFFVSIGGGPIKIWSDNGLFPAAEFQDFLRDWKVGWESSSPHYPQSNGRAEAGIKAIKALVAGSRTGGTFDQNKMAKALLLYRNAPRMGIQSPAQLIFNRPIRASTSTGAQEILRARMAKGSQRNRAEATKNAGEDDQLLQPRRKGFAGIDH
jgi:hypothetical protein